HTHKHTGQPAPSAVPARTSFVRTPHCRCTHTRTASAHPTPIHEHCAPLLLLPQLTLSCPLILYSTVSPCLSLHGAALTAAPSLRAADQPSEGSREMSRSSCGAATVSSTSAPV